MGMPLNCRAEILYQKESPTREILFFRCIRPRSRNHKEEHQIVGANVLAHSMKTISTKKLEPSTSHPLPHSDPGFPPECLSEAAALVVLRIHGRLGPEEPLDHGIVAEPGCLMQRCPASGAAARGQAAGRTQRNEGEKTLRKFGRLKSRSVEMCGHPPRMTNPKRRRIYPL